MDNDIELFKGMKFSNLVEEIVDNSRSKRTQIDVLISDLRTFIKGPNEALTMAPLIREYIDVGVKNDDQLVKLSAVMQRIMTAKSEATGESSLSGGLTEDERKQLQEEIDNLKKEEAVIADLKKEADEKAKEKTDK